MKKNVHAYLFMSYDYLPDYSGKEWRPDVWHRKVDENESRMFIREIDFEVDIPDDFNPIPKQVAVLEKKKREALEQYQRAVADINERLSKLLAIEHTEAA